MWAQPWSEFRQHFVEVHLRWWFRRYGRRGIMATLKVVVMVGATGDSVVGAHSKW
jgi:hypothetical protein